MPLLYACLKLSLAGQRNTDIRQMHMITCLDDFMREDPKMDYFTNKHLPAVYKSVEMIARLYVVDSIRYPK